MYERIQKDLSQVQYILMQKYDYDQSQIYKVVIALLDDILYEKFGYEREEIA